MFPLPAGFRDYSAYLREADHFTSNNQKTEHNVRDERAHSRVRSGAREFVREVGVEHRGNGGAEVVVLELDAHEIGV